jgi:hypothetical protein
LPEKWLFFIFAHPCNALRVDALILAIGDVSNASKIGVLML